ncbi:MAG: rhomboid family intramembrane serine protease [Candidatus Cryptobacteroides sp.]
MTKNIIIINILIMIMTALNEEFMIEKFALFYPTSPFFKPWQIVTHMFMHGGFWHLFFNMYTLFVFGSVLERVWGPKKFLLFYFVTGLGAAALHTGVQFIQAQVYMNQIAEGSIHAQAALHALKMTPTVGASGAIYGLLLGYGMLYPDSRLTLVFPPITLKAKWFVLIFAAIELVTGVTGMGGGIAHFAHLGGMLFGWLMIIYWKKKHRLYDYE